MIQRHCREGSLRHPPTLADHFYHPSDDIIRSISDLLEEDDSISRVKWRDELLADLMSLMHSYRSQTRLNFSNDR